MSAAAVGPESGRLRGQDRADRAGPLRRRIRGGQGGQLLRDRSVPGPGKAPIRAGVNVPYSAEFRDRETNVALLRKLAAQHAQGRRGGQVDRRRLGARQAAEPLVEFDTFRHDLAKAISSQDVWPLVLLVAACVFFGDVFVRRVTVHFDWIGPALAWLWAASCGVRRTSASGRAAGAAAEPQGRGQRAIGRAASGGAVRAASRTQRAGRPAPRRWKKSLQDSRRPHRPQPAPPRAAEQTRARRRRPARRNRTPNACWRRRRKPGRTRIDNRQPEGHS